MGSVEIRQAKKTYGNTAVLHGIDLEILSGEFVVLVGPSGCGKSTLLRMIAGLESITSGTIGIDGRIVNEVAPKDRGVAMVFQNYALYPHMTVRKNLEFALKMAKVERSTISSRVDEVAGILGLRDQLEKKPGQLSGGQKQRVAMGRAMVRQPSVFLFDEPLSNLDAQLRVKMRSEISQLHRRLNSTIVYVTHDQVEAMTLANRIAVMYQGKLEQVGTPDEVYKHPRTRFVASFIGTPSMNFLEAKKFSSLERPAVAESIGFRPSDASLFDAAEMVSVGTGLVTLVEPLGANNYVHLMIGDTPVVVETHADVLPKLESRQSVFARRNRLYFFDINGVALYGERT